MTFLPDLESRLASAADAHGVPGAAIAVQHGRAYAEAAVGILNVDTAVPTTTGSLFQIGSVAKMFTALLVLQLAEDNLIDLDQPVQRYLPSFRVVDEQASATVTVRHLLTHTGGFDGDLFDDTGRGDDSLDRYLDVLAVKGRQLAPPGELFSYCNSGFSVLGALIAQLRGGTWEDSIRSRIVEPLGLKETVLFAEEAIVFRTAAGHVTEESTPVRLSPWQLPRSVGPAGNLCATVGDLVRFGRIFRPGPAADSGPAGGTGSSSRDGVAGVRGGGIVRPETIDEMLTWQTATPAFHTLKGWGLGVKIFNWSGAEIYGHSGNTMGQNAYLRIVPEHDLVIAMVDNNLSGTVGLQGVIADLLTELTGATPPDLPAIPSPPNPVDASALAGEYENPQATYRVAAVGDGLDITRTPTADDRSVGTTHWTAHFVHCRDGIFVRTEAVPGSFATVTFLGDGRYLHNGRASRRVPASRV